jgi:WhiB family redox-sensing transcriptional regulator
MILSKAKQLTTNDEEYEINSQNASLNNTSWMIEAACVDFPEIDFYSSDYQEQKLAKEICDGCPVRQKCLQYALDNKEKDGIWGGANSQELRQVQSIDADGFTFIHKKPIKCLNCGTKKNLTVLERRRTKTLVKCTECNLTWYTKKLIGKRQPYSW